MSDQALPHTLTLVGDQTVSALFSPAPDAFTCLALAHGAGADIRHAVMWSLSDGLARHGVSVLRYQFRYKETGSKRPDPPALAHATVRASVATAADLLGSLPLFAGGKSFGARMTWQAQAAEPLSAVHGLVCFGFPLHPAGKPSIDRARHLDAIQIPILLLQRTRDKLAEVALIRGLAPGLGAGVMLLVTPEADHSFHVPARRGTTDTQVMEGLLDAAASQSTRPPRSGTPPLSRPASGCK